MLTKKTFSDSSEYLFSYTATGQVATETNYRGTTGFSYDNKDRLIRQDNPDGSFLGYTYDLNSNKLSVATANGTTLYTYDALNHLSTVTDPSAGVSTYLYDAVGNQVGIEQANGTITTSFYDTLNRLASQVSSDSLGNPLTSFDYLLDPVGNRLQVTEVTGRLVDYTYDALYRLVSENVTDPVNGNVLFEYTYDAVGNRLTKSVNGGVSESYAYDDNDRLLSSTTSSYHYDDNGNTLSETLSGQTTTYTYDADDRLVKAITPSDVVNFSYDTDGIRQSKSVNGSLTSYLVDKNRPYAQVLEELDNGGSVLVEYTYGADLLSQDSVSNGQSYYHYDGLGSTRGLSNAAEALTDSYDYEAFGEVLSGSGSTPNSYLFAGEQYDGTTGKYYLRARYYTPTNGRFSQMDRWKGKAIQPLTLNKFLYGNANPVIYVDPSGHISIMNVASTFAIAAMRTAIIASHIIRAMTIVQPPGSAVVGWRPDSDHHINFWEAAYWWRNGNGVHQSIPLSRVDLSQVSPSEFKGKTLLSINLDFPSHFSDFNDAVVYGSLTLRLVGPRKVEIANGFDAFNFESHPIRGSLTDQFKTSLRNLATFYAKGSLGQGKAFRIYLTGTAQI